jgi:hypothetical protein
VSDKPPPWKGGGWGWVEARDTVEVATMTSVPPSLHPPLDPLPSREGKIR